MSNRRDFLKILGITVAGIAVAPSAVIKGRKTWMMCYKIHFGKHLVGDVRGLEEMRNMAQRNIDAAIEEAHLSPRGEMQWTVLSPDNMMNPYANVGVFQAKRYAW